jgi:hypothetical protein
MIERRSRATNRTSGSRAIVAGRTARYVCHDLGWANGYIAKLQSGETVSFRPRGDSMSPKIESGQLCTVNPVDASVLRADDIVLGRVRGAEYLHLVKAIQGNRFQIGNNRGRING